ncbi:hypothetical protein SLS55_009087 [Diplodia seriata]|uniref:Uncharacterized protein n=1 Tax=Diplodia seriata TaxID=420778 RepID=A0ABR3C7U9_9PEZI
MEQQKKQRDDADADYDDGDDDDDEGDMRLNNFMEMGHEDLARLTYFMWKVAVVGFSREERAVMLERVKKMQGKLAAGERAGEVLKKIVKEGFEEDEGDEEEDEGYEEEGEEEDDGEEEEDEGEDEEEEGEVDARWTYKRIENWVSRLRPHFLNITQRIPQLRMVGLTIDFEADFESLDTNDAATSTYCYGKSKEAVPVSETCAERSGASGKGLKKLIFDITAYKTGITRSGGDDYCH